MRFHDISQVAVSEYRLPNAFTLYSCPDDANAILCMQLYIKTGSVKEGHREHGYVHFLEHLVFKSTPKYPDNSISAVASKMGAVLNAYTDFDTTCYYLMLPAEKLEAGMDILAEMAMRANFSDDDVNIERDIIVEELHQYEQEPEMDFIEYIQKSYFVHSPLRRPVLGTLTSLKAVTLAKLRRFYQAHYTPANAFLLVTGAFDADYLQSCFTAKFAQWQGSPAFSEVYPVDSFDNMRTFYRKKAGQDLVAIALPELRESHPDSEALHIAIRHLAIGKSSLLHKALVEEQRLCSSVKVSSLSGLLSGISVVLFSPTDTKHIPGILEIFFAEYKKLMQNGIPSDAMMLVKKDIIHSWLYSFDGVENLANLIAAEIFNNDISRVQSYGDYIQSITNLDVQSAIMEHWKMADMAVWHQGAGASHCEIARWRDGEIVDRVATDSTESTEASNRQTVKTSDCQTTTSPNRSLAYQETSPITVSANEAPATTSPSRHLATSPKTTISPSRHLATSPFSHFTLSSGMKVIYNYIPNKPICGFAMSSPLSQLCETTSGVNYFTTALMLYGTKNLNHNEIMRFSREHGFNIRVLHHLDSTIFRGKCFYQDLPKVMDLLSDILHNPVFEPGYLAMLKSAAIDNIKRENDYPVSYAYRRWFSQLFGANNNLFRSTGNVSDIKKLKLSEVEAWYDTWHIGRDFSLCIVGSLEQSMVHELAEKHFGGIKSTILAPSSTACFDTKAATEKRKYLHSGQSIIHIGGLACPASERENNSAFHLLSQVLGGDLSSRLYDLVREKAGYAYQTGFDFSSIHSLGYWYAYAFCNPKDHNKSLALIRDILVDIVHNGITENELASAKSYLIGINRLDLESSSFKAASIANLVSLGYDLDFFLAREQRINAVTLEQIKTLAETWLLPENQQTFVLI